MKILSLAFFVLTIISASYAQENKFERKGGFGKQAMHGKMHHLMFTKRILSEKCIREAKITKEQVAKLKREFESIDKTIFDLSGKIAEASKKQAEIAVKVLTTPGADGREMMKMTDKIGHLRTEQAKLQVRVLMTIRDNLQPPQCAKVVQLMKEEREKMRSRQKAMRERMQNRRPSQTGRQSDPDSPGSKMPHRP